MKVVILVKQVPLVTDLKFDPETKTLIREGVPNVINPYDRYAIVEGVKLKKAHGGEAVAVTMGPPQAREAMVEALALGCDRAVHIVDRAFAGSDTLATARALSLFLKKEGFDLIFCGKYSVDAETGQVGPEVAELLDIPQITGITKLEVTDGGRHIKATRGTDEGQEVIECDLPALAHRRGASESAWPDASAGAGGRPRPADRGADRQRSRRKTRQYSALPAHPPGYPRSTRWPPRVSPSCWMRLPRTTWCTHSPSIC